MFFSITIHRPVSFFLFHILPGCGLALALGIAYNWDSDALFPLFHNLHFLLVLLAMSTCSAIVDRSLQPHIWDIRLGRGPASAPLRGPATRTRQPPGLGLADIDRVLREADLSPERRAELTSLLAAGLDEARS